ncbi:MAG: ABC transporter ATP-binding protein [Thermoleophilia bacterium]
MSGALLQTRNLKKHFPLTKGALIHRVIGHVKAVDGISFDVFEGDVFGIVGESGCGKTTTLKMILGLEDQTDGEIIFDDRDVSRLTGKELKWYRRSVQTMFQDPYSSLNPRMKVGDFLREPISIHLKLNKAETTDRINRVLDEVCLCRSSADLYPHEFSGGQRQRIALARAIVLEPRLVVLDEPVSALDVSVQAQLMNLLLDIKEERGFSYLVIAHNLSVVRYLCNRMAVMYLGKIVECGDSEEIYQRRLHPYTKALFSAALPAEPDAVDEEIILSGEVPSPISAPSGCHFHPRCLYAQDVCREVEPLLEEVERDHQVSCHFWRDIE